MVRHVTRAPLRQRWWEILWSLGIGFGLIILASIGIVTGLTVANLGPISIGFYGVISFFHLATEILFASLNRVLVRRLIALARKTNFQPRAIKVRVGYREDPELDRISLESLRDLTYPNLVATITVIDGNEGPKDRAMAENAREILDAAVITVNYALVDYVLDDGTMTEEGQQLEAQLAAQVMEAAATHKHICIAQPHRHKRAALLTADLMAGHFSDIQVVTHMDSDTKSKDDEVDYLVAMYVNPEVVGVTGKVKVIYYNTITLLQDLRYAWAFDGERASESKRGFVNCQSGPSSSYLLGILLQIIFLWLVEKFMGRKPHVGEDRQYTRMIGAFGLVLYCHEAEADTEAPDNIPRHSRQLRRWARSKNREAPRTVPVVKRDWWLSFNLAYNTIFPLFLLQSIVYALTRGAVYGEWIHLGAWVVTVLLAGFIRSCFLVVVNGHLRYFLFSLYGFYYVPVVLPQQFIGLFTVYQSDVWVTSARAEIGASRFPRWVKTALYIALLILLAIAASLIPPGPGVP